MSPWYTTSQMRIHISECNWPTRAPSPSVRSARATATASAPPAARRMMRSQAQVWLGLAGDPLRALPTHTGTSTAFRCSACNVICSGTVYMARDCSFCCENHRDRQFLKRGQPDSPLRPRSTSPPAREPAPSWRDYPQP